MSQIPYDLSKLKKEEIDGEILRLGMVAELDAVNLYEQLAAMAENPDVRKVFRDIIREEKTHLAEFQTLLLREDGEQALESKKGQKEVEELTEE